MEIRQILTESGEGCYITAFHLEVEDNIPLDDFAEIKDQPSIKPNCTIKMRFSKYDDIGVRLHIQHTVDLIDSPLSDVYVASGSMVQVQSSDGKKDRSYPSFMSVVAEHSKKKSKEKVGKELGASSTISDLDHALDIQSDVIPFVQRAAVINLATSRANPDSRNRGKDAHRTKVPTPKEEDLEGMLDGPAPLTYMRALVAASNSTGYLPRPYISLSYSGWNPVPAHRRLQGELYYLEVVLHELTTLHITCTTTGFFVNATTDDQTLRVDRHPKYPFKSETLLGLLYLCSPHFAAKMDYIVQVRSLLHPFESSPLQGFCPKPWLMDMGEATDRHTHNPFRGQMSIAEACQAPDPRNPCREWNEEMQSCKDLPGSTTDEALVRDRTLAKVHHDFLEAAVRGCVAVVDRQMGPINPMDPELYHVFMNNNIFFSYAVDGRGIYKDIGGDQAAHALAKQDLHGLRLVGDLDIPGVCVIDTVVVDYKGRRVVAQSILPGILQGEQEHKHVHGAVDNTKDVRWDAAFHEAFSKVAEKLQFRPHKIRNSDGTVHEMALTSDCKGIKGADNRLYMLELIRFAPRDPNFLDRPTACLRPELMEILIKRKKRRQAVDEYVKARLRAEAEAIQKAEGGSPQPKDESGSSAPQSHSSAAEGAAVKEEAAAAGADAADGPLDKDAAGLDGAGPLLFNCDAFTAYALADDPETVAQDEQTIRLAAEFVTQQIIPQMMADFASLELTVIDTVSLTHTFHERGVNMRYLGRVAGLCTKETEFVRRLLVLEMVARACKATLRALLEATYSKAEEDVPVVVAKYLSAVLGTHPRTIPSDAPAPDPAAIDVHANGTATEEAQDSPRGRRKGGNRRKKKQPVVHRAPVRLEIADPVADICRQIKEKYQYDLDPDPAVWWALFDRVSLLRAVCLKLGLRLKSREYSFAGERPVLPEDIAEFYPLVHHVPPKCRTPQAAMDNGMMLLQMGNFDTAFASLNAALGMYHQILGPMNKEVATCFSYIGNIMHYASDIQQALLYHHKALLIGRRVLGFDSSLPAHIHQYMGLICHKMGRNDLALEHFRRGYYLMRLAAGFPHPEACISLANVGMMYQELGNHHKAVECLKQALQHSEAMLGPNHPQFTSQYVACCYALSVSLAQVGDFKEAVAFQRKVCEVQRTAGGGASDAATVEAEKWLSALLKLAVDAQRKVVGAAPKPTTSNVLWPKGRRLG